MTFAKSLLVAFAISASTSTAMAADVHLYGFGHDVWDPNAPKVSTIELDPPPTLEVSIGGQKLKLEETTLAELVKRFGGAIHSQGDAGDFLAWVCYADAAVGRTLWFASDEMGGGEVVMSFAVAADGSKDEAGCSKPSETISDVTINVPSIGSSAADIDHALATKIGQPLSVLLYGVKPGAEKDWTIGTWIHYKLDGGKVIGVAAGQSTTN